MGMTITEKIISKACGKDKVIPGEIVSVKIDKLMTMDANAPIVFRQFEKLGVSKLYDPDLLVVHTDHLAPGHTVKDAETIKQTRDYSKKYGAKMYDIGRHGICHQMMVENAHVRPGSITFGTDSHATTYGAMGAFSCGVSATEAAVIMATGECWVRVPGSIKINLTGKLPRGTYGKDIALKMMSILGCEKEATYMAVEIGGDGVGSLDIADRLTICNLVAETGAKNGIIAADEKTVAYYKAAGGGDDSVLLNSDPDARYETIYEINLSELEPLVSVPHLTSNVKPARELADVRIDHVFIGSCTNGRIEDIAVTAEILKGKKLPDNVRMIVVPASQRIYLEALRAGYIETIMEAGGLFEVSCCGPCAGYNTGLLPAGGVAVSTTNRNFQGRMGHPESFVYLSSPATAAASALEGHIADPRKYIE
jgi:3-isopropylmalate/(R)-2-methylmalate dehydratase large subunit